MGYPHGCFWMPITITNTITNTDTVTVTVTVTEPKIKTKRKTISKSIILSGGGKGSTVAGGLFPPHPTF